MESNGERPLRGKVETDDAEEGDRGAPPLTLSRAQETLSRAASESAHHLATPSVPSINPLAVWGRHRGGSRGSCAEGRRCVLLSPRCGPLEHLRAQLLQSLQG